MPKLPPHEKTSTHLHWRVSRDPLDEKYLAFIREYFSEYLVSYETHSNRPHFHAVINHKGLPSRAFTQLIKTRFPNLNGNADFQVVNIEVGTLETMLEYICKGEEQGKQPPEIILNSGFTNDSIKNMQAQYWIRHISTYFSEESKEQESPQTMLKRISTVKAQTKSFTERVYDYIIENYDNIEWNYRNEAHHELITDIMLTKLGEKSKCISIPQIHTMIEGMFNALDAKHCRQDIKAQLRRYKLQQG